jgi:hypothetical protein
MKITVFNQGGLGHTRLQKRFDEGVQCRVQYSAADKVKIVAAVDKMMAKEHLHQNQATAFLQVSPSLVSRWRAKSSALKQVAQPNFLAVHKDQRQFLPSSRSRCSTMLARWCGKGMDVSRLSLIRKACQLSPGFANKTLAAQKMCISRFMMRNGLTRCMAMHAAQLPPEQVCEEATGHLEVMVPIVDDVNQSSAFTINMDQMPMWYAMTPKTTVESRGSHTVNAHTAMGNSKPITVAVTITASGHQLPLMVVFKGSPKGTIARSEIPTLPTGLFYKVNKKAWFNKQVMLDWVKLVLAPYVATAPKGIVPILFLGMFKCS